MFIVDLYQNVQKIEIDQSYIILHRFTGICNNPRSKLSISSWKRLNNGKYKRDYGDYMLINKKKQVCEVGIC